MRDQELCISCRNRKKCKEMWHKDWNLGDTILSLEETEHGLSTIIERLSTGFSKWITDHTGGQITLQFT